jgi:hypothetical protein
MSLNRTMRGAAAAVLLAVGVIVPTEAANASNPPFTIDFPAGVACSFALHVSGTGGNSAVRTTTPSGMIISGGTGSALTFTGNGNSLSLSSNGVASQSSPNPDGSSTNQVTGHNILILFPTDNPAGPSTTLIVGRVRYIQGADGTTTVQSISGRQVDICAALS